MDYSIGSVGGTINSSSIQQSSSSSAATPSARPKILSKACRLTAITILGMSSVSSVHPTKSNSAIATECVTGIGSMQRTQGGWQDFTLCFVDDLSSSLVNLLSEMMDTYNGNPRTFDVVVEFSDGAHQVMSTLYVHDCSVVEFTTDGFYPNTSNFLNQHSVDVLVRPGKVTYA